MERSGFIRCEHFWTRTDEPPSCAFRWHLSSPAEASLETATIFFGLDPGEHLSNWYINFSFRACRMATYDKCPSVFRKRLHTCYFPILEKFEALNWQWFYSVSIDPPEYHPSCSQISLHCGIVRSGIIIGEILLMLSRSSCKLLNLCVLSDYLDPNTLTSLLVLTPHLVDLQLSSIDAVDMENLAFDFDPPLVPNLRSLMIRSGITVDATALAILVQARCYRGLSR